MAVLVQELHRHRGMAMHARFDEIATLPREAKVTAAVFSPDGAAIATAANDGTVALWNRRIGAFT